MCVLFVTFQDLEKACGVIPSLKAAGIQVQDGGQRRSGLGYLQVLQSREITCKSQREITKRGIKRGHQLRINLWLAVCATTGQGVELGGDGGGG